jgi:hypothetical protein
MLLVLSDEYHMVYHLLFFSLILRQQEQKMTNECSRVLKDVEKKKKKKKSRLESEYYGCTRKF